MKRNVGSIDRAVRITLGLALVAWALFLGGPLWAWVGVVPLATALVGRCPLYPLIGVNTCPLAKR